MEQNKFEEILHKLKSHSFSIISGICLTLAGYIFFTINSQIAKISDGLEKKVDKTDFNRVSEKVDRLDEFILTKVATKDDLKDVKNSLNIILNNILIKK